MARNRFDVDETLEEPLNFKNLKKVMVYVFRYKGRMLSALLLSGIGSIVGLTGPMIIQYAMDYSIPEKNLNQLFQLAILLGITILINVGFNAIRKVIVAQAAQSMVHDIRRDLFEHLQVLPFSYYDNRPHGKILVRIVHYVNSVSDVLSNGLLDFIIEIINIIFIIIFMYQVSPPLASITVAGLPVLIVFVLIIKPRQRRAYQQVSNKNSNLNAYVQESIEGVRVTQAFNRQEENLKILDRLIDERYRAWMRTVYISNSVWFSTETISQIVFSLVYIAGAYWFDPMVSFGVLLAMGTYASKFWQPIVNLANIYNKFIDAMAYLERIFETMNEPPVIEDRPGAHELPPIVGSVRFDHVNFGYEPGQKILRDVSFSAAPGESIAIVGPTGAGKTTIVNLISRFYNIEEGTVSIDGHSVMDVTLHSLRSQMGIMLQDSFVFSGTIADNIRYGRLDASNEDIVRVSKLLCADEFISKLPHGYETIVKERGGGLSQGQKQLIAFARTLLADPKILVLDEATSSIDTSTEQLLQRGINLLLEGRTSFIIAHRLSTIKSCTRIMYVDGGQIKESGSHEELMAKKGYYYDLYMAQYRKDET
ncbi:MAG TPA: ABC transporter ATP-binding protein [Candidatus Gallacutalibacter pullicola]|uniref:ABC transporter ATP-binding protein n=1 Tax=Candidatus Gallacutalibacter pullicola TaxID=2840830 RepID=A0A9D1DS44_9FIRM|nr:ABC transporter ATP-binding protein [Candidatus Gallacutalibacter pullicola]